MNVLYVFLFFLIAELKFFSSLAVKMNLQFRYVNPVWIFTVIFLPNYSHLRNSQ